VGHLVCTMYNLLFVTTSERCLLSSSPQWCLYSDYHSCSRQDDGPWTVQHALRAPEHTTPLTKQHTHDAVAYHAMSDLSAGTSLDHLEMMSLEYIVHLLIFTIQQNQDADDNTMIRA